MSNVSPLPLSVNAITPEMVTQWHLQKAERGELPMNSARLRCTALMQLIGVLGADEPRSDARWILEQIDEIARRYAIKNAANPETVRTYTSRARGALADFFAWHKNPTSFRFQTRERVGAEAAPKKAPTKPPKKAAAPASEPSESSPSNAAPHPPAPAPLPGVPAMRSFPLGVGREVAFSLPVEQPIRVQEAMRFFLHVLTLCDDFDPFSVEQRQLFAMVKAGGVANG